MKYYVYWDEDYNNSDRDELLKVCGTKEEAEEFINSWCRKRAAQVFSKQQLLEPINDEILKLFRGQLFISEKPRYQD